ncbi:MAG TPA: hypothetical protein VII13_21845 [Vicinamibacteria bacterium]
MAASSTLPLPRDAELVELRPDAVTFRTRRCILPGARLRFGLVMEGRPLQIEAPAEACLVVEKGWRGYVFHSRVSLAGLSEADHHLVQLFIDKGRGRATLTSLP